MCGIAGIINLQGNEEIQANQLRLMTDKIRHRGPNDEGYILFSNKTYRLYYGDDTPKVDTNHVSSSSVPREHIRSADKVSSFMSFGHRRLSILDLSFAGHQPMGYLNRYWIIYNGEIYNYIELRKELVKTGYSFNSNSDTEVIMAAYDRWGPHCLNKFNGMWAFALYDSVLGKIFLSRDRFGIKPLYYYKDNKYFVFASEIKALLEHPAVKKAPNTSYCREYLADGPKEYIRETAFKDIYRFAHSGYLELPIVDLRDNDINEVRYWDCSPNLSHEQFDQQKADEYAKRYYELLSDAVKIRLRADVKIGAALSGGLDSSTIVYMINQHLAEVKQKEKLETFSSVYKSNEDVHYCDESAYIDELAEYLSVRSNQIEPLLSEFKQEHRKMIFAMENPAVGPNMGGWYTFKLVGSSDVTINLDGQGADEQLGGYFTYLWRYFANIPLSHIVREFRAFSKVPGVSKTKIFISIVFNLLQRVIPGDLLQKITKNIGKKHDLSIMAPVNKILYESTMSGLINLIHYGDSQSMAHSIESRLPFMDYRLVEFLASMPASYKIHNGWTKYIARHAMNGKLPDTITWRKDKMGWPDPSEFWFRGELKSWLCSEVENSPFLKQLGVGHDIVKRINGKEPILNLIRLLNLSIWHNVYFAENAEGRGAV